MPPKIREMTVNSTPSKDSLRRFTLMLTGEDGADQLEGRDNPRQGLPHERFLLGEMIPLAPVLLLGQSSLPVNPAEVIACLQPVHLHATRDHLILMGQNQIDLTEKESARLLKVVLPFIEEDFENTILFQNQSYWFIPAGPFASLVSYSIDQAHGRNIDWWMPRDSHEGSIAKRWRKLQNEIQMLWHIDQVNEERAQRGMPSINSIWISGIGKLNDVQVPTLLRQSQCLIGPHPILTGLAKLLDIPHEAILDEKNLAGGFAWVDRPETIWPYLSAALKDKQLDEIVIVDFPNGKTRERTFTVNDLSKRSWVFWKKPELLTWQEIVG